ncbi:hypothetical protein CSB37_00410 [bacterium DOLZORAL124_38_8]|nr:MAG: hypothetical protein CSB37_00410 [bacterium DOLZORAL124_38_8]
MKDSFLQLNQARRAVHFYQSGVKLSDEDIKNIIEPVRYTPSGYNAQPWQFVVVRDEERLVELQKIAMNQSHVTEAGNVIIVLGDKNFGENEAERILAEWQEYKNLPPNKVHGLKTSLLKKREDWKQREMMLRNASLAAMNLLLSIEANGFCACPMMGIKQIELKKFLKLPENILPVLFITVGKPHTTKNDGQPLPRKKFEELCWNETFGNHF